jgi:PBSX family phage terminase large subunit
MQKPPVSKKQLVFLKAKDGRINILSGAIRSGKTFISIVKFIVKVCALPKNYEFLMCGKTLTSLKRNCLGLLGMLAGSKNFSYSISKKEGLLFGRKIYFEGANDIQSEDKIMGMTLGGAYCDEISLYPEGFVIMLLGRLSLPGAFLDGTTNPQGPYHWLKVNYIDNENIDANVWHFDIGDNVFLDAEYVKQVKREYTGFWYKRLILGLWCQAEGLIYDSFREEINVIDSLDIAPTEYMASVDYGTNNPCVFHLIGLAGNEARLIKEYYYDSQKARRQKTDGEYALDFENFVNGYNISYVWIDPSASSFKLELAKKGKWPVLSADNSVVDGIRMVSKKFNDGTLKILSCCQRTIKEIYGYVWDSKAQQKGEDKPLKTNDHAMDSKRYGIYSYFKRYI